MAASRPIASLAPPISASAKMSPPNSTRRPGTSMSSAKVLISLPSAVNSSPERSAKLICAYAILPLRAIWRAPSSEYGLTTSTSGIFCSISSNRPSIACWTAAASTPCCAANTTCACTCRLRKLDLSSRSNASWLSVPGSLNSVLNAPLRLLASANVATSRMIHAPSTQRRRRYMKRASRCSMREPHKSRGAPTLRGAPGRGAMSTRSVQRGTVATVGAVHGARACRTAGTPERNGPCQWPTSRSTGSTGPSASPSWSGRTTSAPPSATPSATTGSGTRTCSRGPAARARRPPPGCWRRP